MLTELEARVALVKTLPDCPIQSVIRYKEVYLFRVKLPFPGEEDFDPFFSVDVNTGEVRDFSVITDGDIDEIARLFSERR